MDNITYTYPGATKPTLVNISVKLCLGSRVAVLGANGAGERERERERVCVCV